MKKLIAVLVLSLSLAAQAQHHNLDELPKEFSAASKGADLLSHRAVDVVATSGDAADPARAERLEHMRSVVVARLRKTPFEIATPRAQAQLSMQLVERPHVRWGMYHYQVDPYLFLLLRDRASHELLWCGFHRVGSSYDLALSGLLRDFVTRTESSGVAAGEDAEACAKRATSPYLVVVKGPALTPTPPH